MSMGIGAPRATSPHRRLPDTSSTTPGKPPFLQGASSTS